MKFEVGNGNQRLRSHHCRGEVGFLKVLESDRDRNLVAAVDAVGDDEGSVKGGIRKAVQDSRLQVVHGIAPGAHVKGAGVGEEGFPASRLDGIDNRSDQERADEGGISPFAKVQLDGGKPASFDHLPDAGGIDQRPDFAQQVMLVIRFQINEID